MKTTVKSRIKIILEIQYNLKHTLTNINCKTKLLISFSFSVLQKNYKNKNVKYTKMYFANKIKTN